MSLVFGQPSTHGQAWLNNMTTRRGRVLFLARHFPPSQGSACVRTWNVAKQLARFGWKVTVVTPHHSVWRHVENPLNTERELDREGIEAILTDHRWRFLDPYALKSRNHGWRWVVGGIGRRVARYFGINSGIGWIKEAEKACRKLTSKDVDVILASGPPFASFVLARRLSERLARPYVLDYRDPWVVHHGGSRSALRATRKLERELIENSAAVTVISPSLLAGTPAPNSKLHVVTNGFDPEELDQVKPYEFNHFAIVYTGVFRPPLTVISPVMAALRRLKEKAPGESTEWKFHYYGPQDDHVRQEAEKVGVLDKVAVHGRVPRREALSAVRGASLAVVISSVLEPKAEWEKGIVTGKIFEPLGMHVPILIVGPDGIDLEGIIEKTGLARKVPANDIDGMVSFIGDVMKGKMPQITQPELYAWPSLIKKVDLLLRSVVDESKTNDGIGPLQGLNRHSANVQRLV